MSVLQGKESATSNFKMDTLRNEFNNSIGEITERLNNVCVVLSGVTTRQDSVDYKIRQVQRCLRESWWTHTELTNQISKILNGSIRMEDGSLKVNQSDLERCYEIGQCLENHLRSINEIGTI